MAKMFYSFEEVQQKLSKNAEEVKQLVRDGKLREFRDGAKIMFKVEEVEQMDMSLPAEPAGGEDIKLETGIGDIQLMPDDTTSDKRGLSSTGSAIGLADTGSSIGLSMDSAADQISLDDTGETKPAKDDTVITHGTSKSGINVFDDSDSGIASADPMAQTQMAPDLDDQVQLDSGSSGSGLLDLTREADDTSLGAELLDEIYPGTEEQQETQLPTQFDVGSSAQAPVATAMDSQVAPVIEYTKVVQAYDPTSGIFGGVMVLPLLALIYLGFVAAAKVAGIDAPLVDTLSGIIWYVVGGAALLIIGIVLVGNSMMKKAGQPAKAAAKPAPAKVKAAKPAKKK